MANVPILAVPDALRLYTGPWAGFNEYDLAAVVNATYDTGDKTRTLEMYVREAALSLTSDRSSRWLLPANTPFIVMTPPEGPRKFIAEYKNIRRLSGQIESMRLIRTPGGGLLTITYTNGRKVEASSYSMLFLSWFVRTNKLSGETLDFNGATLETGSLEHYAYERHIRGAPEEAGPFYGLASLMSGWYSGQWDPIYAVCSSWSAGRSVPYDLIQSSMDSLSRSFSTNSARTRNGRELREIVQQLENVLCGDLESVD